MAFLVEAEINLINESVIPLAAAAASVWVHLNTDF